MVIMAQRDLMPATGKCKTVRSNYSRMDDQSAHGI